MFSTVWLLVFAGLIATSGCAHYEARPVSLGAISAEFDQRSLTNTEVTAFIRAVLTNRAPTIDQWDFEALTMAAFYFHPALRVARAQSETALAGKMTAQARPNPTVGLSPGYDFNATNPLSPWIPGLTVELPIETAGKRGKRILQAGHLAEAARWEVAALAWQVRSNLRSALIEVWFAAERERLLRREITNQAALLQSLQQRLEAGAIAGNELLPFQVGRARLQGEVAVAKGAVVQARAHLAEAIGVPARALSAVNIDAAGAARLDASMATNAVELRANALQRRADLLALLARYEAAQAALQLEIARQYPDVRLGSGYQWDQGENKWNLSLTMELPIFNRNKGPIAEAEARRTEVAAQLVAAQARVIHEIDRSFEALVSAREEAARANETLGSMQRQSAMARERLNAGAGDQLEVWTTAMEESAAAVVTLDVNARALAAAAQLEGALQIPFPGLSAAQRAWAHSR